MLNASDSWGPSTQLPRKLVALTPVCNVPKLRASPENMRCLLRSFSTTALQALSHLQVYPSTFGASSSHMKNQLKSVAQAFCCQQTMRAMTPNLWTECKHTPLCTTDRVRAWVCSTGWGMSLSGQAALSKLMQLQTFWQPC